MHATHDQPPEQIVTPPPAVPPPASGGPRLAPEEIGWLLVGAGGVASLATLVGGRRSPLAWSVPLGLIGAGIGVLATRRQAHMHEAEDVIREQLDALDPIARAQVLKAIATEQLGMSGSV